MGPAEENCILLSLTLTIYSHDGRSQEEEEEEEREAAFTTLYKICTLNECPVSLNSEVPSLKIGLH